MAHTVREGLFFRAFPDAVIFLDVPADRYFQIGGQCARYFARFLAGDADPVTLAWLSERGILEVRDNPLPATQAELEPPSKDYAHSEGVRPPAWLVIEAITALLLARRAVRKTPFQQIITRLAMRRSEATHGRSTVIPQSDMRMIACAFERAQRFVDTTDMCLPHSIAILNVLARRRCYPNMVIGVTFPFAAHCWVQQDDKILSDDVDHVRCFDPILIL